MDLSLADGMRFDSGIKRIKMETLMLNLAEKIRTKICFLGHLSTTQYLEMKISHTYKS